MVVEARLALVGFGAVNTTLLQIIGRKRAEIGRRHGIRLVVTGACDSGGGVWAPGRGELAQARARPAAPLLPCHLNRMPKL
mmetsp:Transcript_32582/g.98365  ORF Transcript_32582/g.98365 Transcript_32582/m.98365 type:complete len:81 (-) Transcript_32582:48-290(-)